MNQIIKNVISNFDFEKVHKAMTATNWTWHDTDGVPSIGEITTRAIELLEEAHVLSPGCSVGTGGFTATKCYDEEFGMGLHLEFILTENDFYEGDCEEA